MSAATTTITTKVDAPLKGGEWLLKNAEPATSFMPEQFDDEQRMILDMCKQFLEAEIFPIVAKIDSMQEPGLMKTLMQKAGEQGLLSTAFPEEYGGLNKDFVTATLINEGLGAGHSFSVAIAAHTGIGTLPILYFGTDAQKAKYIPKLASGEWAGAYGLTEPNSGSDALSAKTTAKLSDDGKYYILNGQKCWITNGGFADVYTVFAKIDGKDFSCFIIDKGTEGFTTSPEEHKMGIKGSSTVQLYFQDCKVPVENLLGQQGKGHVIAFNILNLGRLKLCAATLGGSKKCLDITINYANTREQFNTPIASFGAIKYKLAEMAIRCFVSESALYRTSKMIADFEHEALTAGKPFAEALLGAAEEFAIECAMLKVYGSELLDFVVDEGVQVHGGNGFSDEYDISRSYRDSRINRIYEGTNEINRLLTIDMYLKRGMKGRINLMGGAMAVQKELMGIPDFGATDETPFATETALVANLKKATLLCAGAAAQKLMQKLESEQEVIMNLADMAIMGFHAESVLHRAIQMANTNHQHASLAKDMAFVFIYDACDKVNKYGKDALNAFADGDELRMMLMGLKRFTKTQPYNNKAARRRIADALIAEDKYIF